jgi:hypothetical protein
VLVTRAEGPRLLPEQGNGGALSGLESAPDSFEPDSATEDVVNDVIVFWGAPGHVLPAPWPRGGANSRDRLDCAGDRRTAGEGFTGVAS